MSSQQRNDGSHDLRPGFVSEITPTSDHNQRVADQSCSSTNGLHLAPIAGCSSSTPSTNNDPAAPSKLLTPNRGRGIQQRPASILEPNPLDTRHSDEGVSSKMVIQSPLTRKKRLSSASMPQLREAAAGTSPIAVTSIPPQMVTRSDMDMHSSFKARGRRRRHDGQQLSPRPHMNNHQRGSNAPPSPSSPATPTSVQSGKSRHSSFRRNAASSAAAQAAAAEDLADQQSLKVISRSMSSYRVVHLLYQTDADLFDAIMNWKDNHPTLWVDDAIDAFGKSNSAVCRM